MQKRILKALQGVGISAIFAACALASPPTTYFQLTGVQGATLPVGGVYTSPYFATIGSTTNVPVICDDFADDTYFNESWTAYMTDLSGVDSSSVVKWKSGSAGFGLTEDQAYTVAAYLGTEILGAVAGSQNQQDLSYALWGLFDPAAFSYLTSSGYSGDASTAQTDVQNAITYVANHGLTTANFAGQTGATVTIYSYDTGAMCGSGPCPTAPPQEFIKVSMAEPSYPTVLGLDLLAAIGLMVTFRRRFAGISVK